MGFWVFRLLASVRQTHAAAGFVTEVDTDAEEISGASGFAALATHTILSTRRGGDLASLATVPRDHFKDVQGTSTHTLCATNAGVVDLDGVGHVPVPMRMT